MAYPKIWDLMDEFKKRCRTIGWKVYKSDDLIEAENQNHKFFWIHDLHSETFKKIVMDTSCSVCEDVSIKTVNFFYKAWILINKPSWDIWLYMVKEASRLSRTVAIFDLSQAYEGERTCLKLNETKSVVFQKFENFLSEKYETRVRSLVSFPLPPHDTTIYNKHFPREDVPHKKIPLAHS